MWPFIAGIALQAEEFTPISAEERLEIAAACANNGDCRSSIAEISLADTQPTLCSGFSCSLPSWVQTGVMYRYSMDTALAYQSSQCSVTKGRAASQLRPFVMQRFGASGIPLLNVDASEDLLVFQGPAPLPAGASRAVYEVEIDLSSLPLHGRTNSPCRVSAEARLAVKFPPSRWRSIDDHFTNGLTNAIYSAFYGGASQ